LGEVRVALAGALLALSGCATLGGAALLPGARYVSLGSSFAAGAGIGPTKPGTPERCGRTTNNYATLLAARLRLTLDDVGCGGATTAHVLGPWNELPPQIDAVTADTRLVTITIGGNDLNYVGTLFAGSCDPAVGLLVQGRKLPCPTGKPKAPDDAALARLRASLRAIATQVKARAPRARLAFVQYVTLVPAAACPASGLSSEAAAVAREIGLRLAEATAEVAKETGALLVPADQMSRDHTPCDRSPWAKGRATPADPLPGAPWHPNAAGHAAIADALAEKLGS
jgi:lysophospholipase L1-like esterase